MTIIAVATQSLSRFDLDFAGDSVGSVSVDGRPAAFRRDGEELVITPDFPLPTGLPFVVRVAHYTAQDLRAFLNDWIYGTKTPPMPGHPDWTVDPAPAGARALSAPQERLLSLPRSWIKPRLEREAGDRQRPPDTSRMPAVQ